jgi:hypothetical protein
MERPIELNMGPSLAGVLLCSFVHGNTFGRGLPLVETNFCHKRKEPDND